MSGTRPRYQLYGRRKGHALRRHHVQLIEMLLPKLRVDLKNPLSEFPLLPSAGWEKVPDRADEGSSSQLEQTSVVFVAPSQEPSSGLRPPSSIRLRPRATPDGGRGDMAAETWLEIGFGGGEHLARQAELHPDIRFIGAEPFINGVAKLLALIEERQLTNIRIFDGDARYLLEALPGGSIDRIFLLYPDPWPKVRHHKRRFVNRDNLRHLHRVLKPRGRFVVASDIPEYVEWTRETLALHGGFISAVDSTEPPRDWVSTRYEAKALAAGRIPHYLEFRSFNPAGRRQAKQ